MRTVRISVLSLCALLTLQGVSAATIAFAPSEPIIVARRPFLIAVGDMNNDDIDDVVVASRGTNIISILLVTENAEFVQAATRTFGRNLRGLTIGDFDRDGNNDVVLVSGGKDVFMMFGHGDGTISRTRQFRRCCSGRAALAADVDKKNGVDLLIANPRNNDVSVLLNKGDGTFESEKRFAAARRPESLVEGVFDGDGFPDFAALNTRGFGDVTTYIAAGDNLTKIADFNGGKGARLLAEADMNLDGISDVLVGNGSRREVNILIGQGNGRLFSPLTQTFRCEGPSQSGSGASCRLRALLGADFDLDGRSDIAVAVSYPGVSTQFGTLETVEFAPGLGSLTFGSSIRVDRVGNSIRALALGNFNRDNLVDVALMSVRDTSVRILRNVSIAGTPVPITASATPTATGGGSGPTRTPTPTMGTSCDQKGCPCVLDDDCTLGPPPLFCSDENVCCDTPCNGTNERCDLPGSLGTCRNTGKDNGDVCDVDGECTSGFCADGFCCNQRCGGAQEACNVSGSVGICTPILTPKVPTTTPTAPPPTRTPTGPQASRTPTPPTTKKPTGSACANGTECTSTFCTDGVCCNSACTGATEACNVSGSVGQCTSTTKKDLGEACTQNAECTSNFCVDGVCCNTGCTGTNEACNVSGSLGICVTIPGGDKLPGEACTSNSECNTNLCVDGVCCTTACNGTDQACNIPGSEGTCQNTNLPKGADCQNDAQCEAGCVCSANDDVCCDRRCDGAHERCDMPGQEGTCVDTGVGDPTATPRQTRTPTRTFTPIPTRGTQTFLTRGSGCNAGDDSGNGSLALLLGLPALWWVSTRRRQQQPVRDRTRFPRRDA